jgi:hypothetical protein
MSQIVPSGYCTVIRFVSVGAKFGICIVVSVNGTLVEAQTRTIVAQSPLNVRVLSSTSVPFTLTTEQVPKIALGETKRIALWYGSGSTMLTNTETFSCACCSHAPPPSYNKH